MIKSLFEGIFSLIYPDNCLICRKHIITQSSPTEFLCPSCLVTIKKNVPPFCVKCSKHLKEPITHTTCPSCRYNKPAFDFAWSACEYSSTLKELLHRFKYQNKTLLRHLFTELIIAFIDQYDLDINQFDLIIPMPLHSARKRERGFNQSELLANAVGKHFKIPVNTKILSRRLNTKSQTLLSKKERWTNIKGAFRIKPINSINNISVLLIDDLLTTGATASEAAKILKENGALTVGVLTLATAIH